MPPPEPFCDACGDAFETTAEERGVNLTVEHSTVRIVVDDRGQATWVVRNRVAEADDAARLRADRSLLLALTEDGQRNTEFLGANVTEDGVVTVRYRDDDFATRTAGGALRSDVFTDLQGYRNVQGLGADRLVVEAPEGMRVGWSVPDASLSDGGKRATLTSYESGFVTFVPEDSALGPLLSVLAVGGMAGGAATGASALVLALPAFLFGGLAGAFAGVLGWRTPDRAWLRSTATLSYVASAGLAAILALLVSVGRFPLGEATLPLVGATLALPVLGLALSRPPLRKRPTYPRVLAGAAGGIVLAVLVTAVAARSVVDAGPSLDLLVNSLLAALPAGYAHARKRWIVGIATAAAGFALAMLPVAAVVSQGGGHWVVAVIFGIVSAALGAILALPVLVAGMSVGDGRGETERRPDDEAIRA